MKILVADDSPVLRAAVTKLLQPAGYAVVAAEDGVEAITSAYEERPDLILLDVSMPKLTGYVVCRLLKEDPVMSQIPVLILTARDSEEDRYWGAQSGADGYLTKDSLGEGLLTVIRSTLASQALAELNRSQTEDAQPVLGEIDVLARVCEMLDRKLFEATVVNELTAVGNRSLGVQASVDEILRGTRRLVKFDIGAVVTVEDLTMYTRLESEVSAGDFDELTIFATRKMQSIVDSEVETHDLRVVVLDERQPIHAEANGWGSYYASTLRVRRKPLALFVLGSRRSGAFPDQAIRTLRTVEPAVAAVVESAQRFQTALRQEASSHLTALSGL